MEELIKAKDEQIEKLNDLKELLKNQILSLQEENTKLKNDLFEIEEKIRQLPMDNSPKPNYQDTFNSINAKLSIIEEKLDKITVEGLVSKASLPQSKSIPQDNPVNKKSIQKTKSAPAKQGLLKPSSLFPELEEESPKQSTGPQLYQEKPSKQNSEKSEPHPTESFHAADPRSLQRTVMEIDYPENGVIQCPKCGKMDFNEMPEPARGSFAKKYYCKKCRQEWRFIY
jgi:hypothetical protein